LRWPWPWIFAFFSGFSWRGGGLPVEMGVVAAGGPALSVTRTVAPEGTRRPAAGACLVIDPRGAADAAVPATARASPFCASTAVAEATLVPTRRGTGSVVGAAVVETFLA
jgi:hypothetical protein